VARTVVVHDFLEVGEGVACAGGGVGLRGLLDALEELALLVRPQEALQVDHPLLQLSCPPAEQQKHNKIIKN
jgi:hypothetical protein